MQSGSAKRKAMGVARQQEVPFEQWRAVRHLAIDTKKDKNCYPQEAHT